MWTRQDLKMRGKMAFQRNYWPCVAVALILAIVTGVGSTSSFRSGRDYGDYYFNNYSFSSFFTTSLVVTGTFIFLAAIILIVFVGNILQVGGNHFFVLNQTENANVGIIGHGFKSGNYGNIVLVMFMRDLFTYLWTLLFIIPGIVKSYEYKMIPYILAENPGMPRQEAFLISKKMMMGQKWDVFVLDLSFIGWELLSLCTCGLLNVFYVEPYRQATLAELYTANRTMAYESGFIR